MDLQIPAALGVEVQRPDAGGIRARAVWRLPLDDNLARGRVVKVGVWRREDLVADHFAGGQVGEIGGDAGGDGVGADESGVVFEGAGDGPGGEDGDEGVRAEGVFVGEEGAFEGVDDGVEPGAVGTRGVEGRLDEVLDDDGLAGEENDGRAAVAFYCCVDAARTGVEMEDAGWSTGCHFVRLRGAVV